MPECSNLRSGSYYRTILSLRNQLMAQSVEPFKAQATVLLLKSLILPEALLEANLLVMMANSVLTDWLQVLTKFVYFKTGL